MNDQTNKILIADDEETFAFSTADLLKARGYRCDCASDGNTASEMLTRKEYDLIIADIKMPGNPDLELIKQIRKAKPAIPVILVTGYPSLRSAIDSVQLPVSAYLIKPVDFDQLLAHVENALRERTMYETVKQSKDQLNQWKQNIADIEKIIQNPKNLQPDATLDDFADLTFQNILKALSDLKELTSLKTQAQKQKPPCHLFQCPRLAELTQALAHAISVLEETKTAFKSKKLAELRKYLQDVINESPFESSQTRKSHDRHQ